jgi:hypothetical protein
MAGVITLSIVLIFLIHQVYEYLKKSFSKPLERNIVNETKSHYEQIYNTLAASRQNQMMPPIEQLPQLPTTQPDNMADELMNFMSDLDNAQPDVVIDNTSQYEQEIAPYVDDGSMATF